jgi:hypothetical protein
MPTISLIIVGREILMLYLEENVVIYPPREGTNTLGSENVSGRISNFTIDSSSRGKSKVVIGVDTVGVVSP